MTGETQVERRQWRRDAHFSTVVTLLEESAIPLSLQHPSRVDVNIASACVVCRWALVTISSERDFGPKNAITGTWYVLFCVSSESETTPPVHDLVVKTTFRRGCPKMKACGRGAQPVLRYYRIVGDGRSTA